MLQKRSYSVYKYKYKEDIKYYDSKQGEKIVVHVLQVQEARTITYQTKTKTRTRK
jgi:hypothetical protein